MNNLKTIKTLTFGQTTYEIVDEQARLDIATLNSTINNCKEQTTETSAKYFDIDYDGIISLKPEYRGASDNDTFAYSISDKGLNVAGSKASELPKRIVIPEIIGNTAVTGFQEATFYKNERLKELRLPNGIKTLPKAFCFHAKNLHTIENTEKIEVLGGGAFGTTSIKKAFFPNAKQFNASCFSKCALLTVVDIGNITEIPNQCFMGACNLSAVFGGDYVTSVGKYGFLGTRRLRNLSFISNLNSLSEYAFMGSRVTLDNLPSTCTVGTYSTYKQYNNGVDYWSGCTYTPCETPLLTLFNQNNPLWVGLNVGNNDTKYSQGCGTIVGAEIYSALEGVEFSTPKDFEAVLASIDPTLLDKDMGYSTQAVEIFEALGYSVDYYSIVDNGAITNCEITNSPLQKIYDALADGALLYKCISTYTGINGGHVVIGYGVNEIGELLVADSDNTLSDLGIYKSLKYSMPLQALGTANCDIIVVQKK